MQDVKEYLKNYLKLNNEINELLLQKEHWKSKAEKMTFVISDMPKGSEPQTRENTYIKIYEIDKLIDKLIDKYADQKKDIEKMICSLKNPTWRAILRYIYIDGYNCLQISYKIGYSHDHTKHMHGYALEELRKIYNI